MFFNHKKSVFKKPISTAITSHSAIEFYNQFAPQGTKYKVNDDKSLILEIPNNAKIKIVNAKFILTDEQKSILGEDYQNSDVLNFMENSQQPIKIKFDNNNGGVFLNGQKISFNDVYKTLGNIEFKDEELYIFPQKFPPAHEIEIKSGRMVRRFKIQRVPNPSVSIMKFESINNKIMKITILLNTINNSMSISIIYNIKFAKSAKEIYHAYNFYLGMLKGKCEVANNKINIGDEYLSEIMNFQSLTNFWKKVSEIEEKTRIKLLPTEEKDFDFETIKTVEILFQSLCKKNVIRINEKLNSVEMDETFDEEKINGFKEKCCAYVFNNDIVLTLFEKKFNLIKSFVTYDLLIASVESLPNGKTKVNFTYKDENNIFSAYKLYFTKDDFEIDPIKLNTVKSKAKYIEEYLHY